MTIDNIVKTINDNLAGELLTFNNLKPLLDEVIDDINAKLDSTYPTFSDFTYENYPEVYPNYNFFPDRYIREVVCKGAAYKFYVVDEEGIPTAQQFQYNYTDQLFIMERDFLDKVPEEFQADNSGSVSHLSDVAWKHPWIHGGIF